MTPSTNEPLMFTAHVPHGNAAADPGLHEAVEQVARARTDRGRDQERDPHAGAHARTTRLASTTPSHAAAMPATKLATT